MTALTGKVINECHANKPDIRTIAQLTKIGCSIESVKDEMRRNLQLKIKNRSDLFPGIIGYDQTVVPSLINAILSKHNIILLGLRGQAKTRLTRSLQDLLDEWSPAIAGSPLNCHPLQPNCAYSRRIIAEDGDDTEIYWRHRSERYQEKLATPDVSIADLIGDLDPIKAAREKRDLTDEEVISFGIIPRSCRGIFAINELPDLQARIQVGLLNILEENDLQIRGFPVRIPMDLVLVFTANPEDYTNRGNIITPLKDRIDSQILTHYPRSMEDSMVITTQESWIDREEPVNIPPFFREIIESVAFVARTSEYIDRSSGVSARLTISLIENIVSNMERRNLITCESNSTPRFPDLHAGISAITGKVELAYEGEREGLALVAANLIGRAIKQIFSNYFPNIEKADNIPIHSDPIFGEIISYFAKTEPLELSDESPLEEHYKTLSKVPNLEATARKYLDINSTAEVLLGMEFVLEGLHQETACTNLPT